MHRLPVCVFSVASLLSGAAFAATDGGEHAVRGAGLLDCRTYLAEQEKRSNAYLMIGGWIDGYITGVNQYAAATYDATSFESTELFAEIIKNHCSKNPDDRLFPVMNSILRQRWSDRVEQRTPQINVKLGEQSAGLYEQTILRMQQRLADKGLLEGAPTGRFDAATISAIAAFQKTLGGYEPSGFPDQATLFALFAD